MESGGGCRYGLRSRSRKTMEEGNSAGSTVAEGPEKKKRARPVAEEGSLTKKMKVKVKRTYSQDERCAKLGLEAWNKQQKRKKGPQYELVQDLGSSAWLEWQKGFMFHANFEAKPVGAQDNETELFFVEIRTHRLQRRNKSRIVDEVLRCIPLERVGPDCSADDILHGCLNCHHSFAICHPADGKFDVGPLDKCAIMERENEDLL
ncbi:hypothetical protein Ancab_011115 [Ancistrocladus abbreviatus]